jgi:hypothetical protein
MHRDALNHPLLQDGERFRAWFWLVAKACWNNGCGTLSFTWPVFAAHMGWNQLSAKRCLATFEKHEMVDVDRRSSRVVVTILDRSIFSLPQMSGNGVGHVSSPCISYGRARPVFGVEREPIPAMAREAVIRRDGWKCVYCGDDAGPFEIDHVLAVVNGGASDVSNLCVACKPCNRSKGAKLLAGWSHP